MGGAGHSVHFLDACFLCRKPLASNRDIFMYRYRHRYFSLPSFPCCFRNGALTSHACMPANRGDTAFCSDECRSAQMAADEAAERRKARAVTHGALPAREAEGPPQERGKKVRAGSILAL